MIVYQELKGKSLVEWHKASDVLPNNYECVLCYIKKTKSYEVMEYDKTYKYFSSSEGAVFLVNDVIAWASIPEYEGELEQKMFINELIIDSSGDSSVKQKFIINKIKGGK